MEQPVRGPKVNPRDEERKKLRQEIQKQRREKKDFGVEING